MKRASTILLTVAMAGASVTSFSSSARSENGQIAAGILGGLAVGTILGAATAPRPYYAPPPVYIEPAPVYVAPPPPRCYWTHGEPVWDGWRGAWMRPQVRVCD